MPTLSFHTIDDALITQIETRARAGASRSEVVETALNSYFLILADARRTLKATLTGEELYLICDALNGTLIDAMWIKHLRAEIIDAIEINGLDEKWKVDRHALDKKLARLTLAESFALADAVRTFWRKVATGEDGAQTRSPLEAGILD